MPEPTTPITERITGALADALVTGELPDGGMVDSWVLAATYFDADGVARMVLAANEDASLHTTLGLLDVAQATYRDEARRWVQGAGGEA